MGEQLVRAHALQRTALWLSAPQGGPVTSSRGSRAPFWSLCTRATLKTVLECKEGAVLVEQASKPSSPSFSFLQCLIRTHGVC